MDLSPLFTTGKSSPAQKTLAQPIGTALATASSLIQSATSRTQSPAGAANGLASSLGFSNFKAQVRVCALPRKLFLFAEAYVRLGLDRQPYGLAVWPNYIESHLTAGRFDEISALLAKDTPALGGRSGDSIEHRYWLRHGHLARKLLSQPSDASHRPNKLAPYQPRPGSFSTRERSARTSPGFSALSSSVVFICPRLRRRPLDTVRHLRSPS